MQHKNRGLPYPQNGNQSIIHKIDNLCSSRMIHPLVYSAYVFSASATVVISAIPEE